MDKVKLQTLKGFRDFLPVEARKRQYVINKIRETFDLFGFEPLETPSLEYQEVLLGKYGEEADKLLYTFEDKGGRRVALRYDQTVPTARVIANYQNELTPPWRRYQIQNVWRAEKPQKGRFREFLMCDVDIYGTKSPTADAEIIAVSYHALKELGFTKFKFLINDRVNLFNLMNSAEIPKENQLSAIQTLDKLDKKSQKEVIDELSEKGLTDEKINKIFDELDKSVPTSELENVIRTSFSLGVDKKSIEFEPSLARGLDYYTGTIFETVIDGYSAGSVAGGGRYDELIEKLSGVSVPAVGLAFGFDRVVEAMEQFNLFPKKFGRTEVLVTIFGTEQSRMSALVAATLREDGISTELFPDDKTKLDKQLKYANKKEIKYAVIIGPSEVKKDEVQLKNLDSGKQESVKLSELVENIKK